jgi:predicted transcriptional regulator
MVYALIYGFCQDEKSKYMGSAQYIADSLNISRQSVSFILSKLTEKNYIVKSDRTENGIKFCDYEVAKEKIPDNDFLKEILHDIKKLDTPVKKLDTPVKKLDTPVKKLDTPVKKLDTPVKKLDTIDLLEEEESSSSDPPESEKAFLKEEPVLHKYSKNCDFPDPQESGEFSQRKTGPPFSISSLKQVFKQLDGSLIFSDDFYSRASSFMVSNHLDFNYISWLYSFCLRRNPKNIDNYLFKVFFDSRLVDLFLENFKPPSVSLISCPVCGAEHDSGLSECPVCGLNSSGRHNQEQINQKKRFYDLPSDLKDAYEQEFNSLHESTKHLDFRERRTQLENLDRKYGLIDTC